MFIGMIVAISFAFCVFITMLCALLRCYCKRKRRLERESILLQDQLQLSYSQHNAADLRQRQTHETLIQKYNDIIPIVSYRFTDRFTNEFETPECVICMESFVEDDQLRKLPTCRHIFHAECLMKWLSSEKQRVS